MGIIEADWTATTEPERTPTRRQWRRHACKQPCVTVCLRWSQSCSEIVNTWRRSSNKLVSVRSANTAERSAVAVADRRPPAHARPLDRQREVDQDVGVLLAGSANFGRLEGKSALWKDYPRGSNGAAVTTKKLLAATQVLSVVVGCKNKADIKLTGPRWAGDPESLTAIKLPG